MRFLLQGKTGKVLAYTDDLAKRPDMAEITKEVADAIRSNKPVPVQAPGSLDDLAQISGVGAKKLQAYGREILRVLDGQR